MKTQVAVDFHHASSFLAYPSEAWTNESNRNGNWNSPPAPHLQSRPISVPSGWFPACYRDSGMPSSLKDWLVSKDALVIG
jgi:hypothetical protein